MAISAQGAAFLYYYENRNREAYRCFRGQIQDGRAHFHSQAELCVALSGTVAFSVCDKTYEAERGDVFVFFPYQVHSCVCGAEILQILVDHRLTPEYHCAFTELWPVSPLLPRDAKLPILRSLMDGLSELYANRCSDRYGEISLRGCVIAIWGEILSMLRLEKSDSRSDYGLFQRAIRYCVENYNDTDITLNKAAQELNINRTYLSSLFKHNLNCGFNIYLNHLRIVHVCYLLAEERSSITEAAFSSGFANLRTFNRVFRKQVGMTPSSYRLQAGSGGFMLAPPSEKMPI